MDMFGIKISKSNRDLVIKWQLSKTVIPIKEINHIKLDDTYGGEDKTATKIGTPYGTTNRIVIQTNERNYILFTTNVHTLLKQLEKYSNVPLDEGTH